MFLRKLDLGKVADQSIAADVLLRSPGYMLSSYGMLPSVEACVDLARSFPPDCAEQDRLCFAAFIKDSPVALAQVGQHWPSRRQASILLLTVAESEHRGHLGCEVVERLSKQARRWEGIESWYLSVLDNSPAALNFWRHCGFHTVALDIEAPGMPGRMINMRRALKTRPVCQHGKIHDNPAQLRNLCIAARFG